MEEFISSSNSPQDLERKARVSTKIVLLKELRDRIINEFHLTYPELTMEIVWENMFAWGKILYPVVKISNKVPVAK